VSYAVLFDLDSTIASTLHRQWMVDLIRSGARGAPTWDDYSMACAKDEPIEGTIALMRILAMDNHLFIITGRSEAARELTLDWLSNHLVPFDDLYMRPAGDRTANGKYKVQTIEKLRERGYNPGLFVEDWPEAADYIREHAGIPVLLVNANYPKDAPHQNGGAV
jgi:uncharacterized HAD superfamily protein